VANTSKNATPWWNHNVKDAIEATKTAYKAWLQNKAKSSFQTRYAEARKSTSVTVKKSNMQSWRIPGRNWIPITGKPTKYQVSPLQTISYC